MAEKLEKTAVCVCVLVCTVVGQTSQWQNYLEITVVTSRQMGPCWQIRPVVQQQTHGQRDRQARTRRHMCVSHIQKWQI